jgi:hypothetical protein
MKKKKNQILGHPTEEGCKMKTSVFLDNFWRYNNIERLYQEFCQDSTTKVEFLVSVKVKTGKSRLPKERGSKGQIQKNLARQNGRLYRKKGGLPSASVYGVPAV